jgi:pyruvate/2-oxoglutarate dehydrogenase complex dihydrolipoamide acyltransferase (E2) component
MNLTVSFNHDVVDGAQMGRFITALRRRIETPAAASFTE